MVNIGNSWDEILKDEFDKEYYQNLRKFLAYEYRKYTVYPDMYDIFNSLKYTAYEDVSVVIIGQDPYHNEGEAHGLSFSVPKGIRTPPSLLNIYKEIRDDLGYEIPSHGCLVSWAEQGVLLLNATLTVRAGQANSHQGKGWEILTDEIIRKLNDRDKPVVFILWGRYARDKKKLITNYRHLVLEGAHPSPLSASNGFFGGRYFSKANEFLTENGIEPIDWEIKDGNQA